MSKHLTDEQLLESDAFNNIHLTSCENCKLRLQHISQIRNKLIAIPLLIAPESIGQNIDFHSQAKHKQRLLGQTQRSSEKKLLWQSVLVSMAASIAVVIVISWWRVSAPINENVYSALAKIIDKNNQVFSPSKDHMGKMAVFIDLQFDDELSRIESDIQNAYLNNSLPEQKLQLWEQRHALLIKIKQSQLTSSLQQI